MIDAIAKVFLAVSDPNQALEFYTQTLNFKVVQDVTMGDSRWIELMPNGAFTHLVLVKSPAQSEHQAQSIVFSVTDMTATAADLKAKGVVFTMEPVSHPWAIEASIQDKEGNNLVLQEQPKAQS